MSMISYDKRDVRMALDISLRRMVMLSSSFQVGIIIDSPFFVITNKKPNLPITVDWAVYVRGINSNDYYIPIS